MTTNFDTSVKVVKTAAGTEDLLAALEYTQKHFDELTKGERVAHRIVFGGFKKLLG